MNILYQPAPGGPLTDLLQRIYGFALNLLTMLLILIIGLLAAWVVKRGLQSLLQATKFDRFGHRVGFSDALKRAAIRGTPTSVVTALVYWVIIFSFLMLALYALQVEALDRLINDFFVFLPRLVAALVILFGGHLLSLFLARTVLVWAVNAGLQFARLLALGVQVLVLFFFVAVALTQLRIGSGIIVATFSILLGGVVLALAIAFGLGGRDLAKELLENQFGRARPEAEKEKDEAEETKGFEEFHPL